MSANVENSDLPLKEILKPTGFYPPKNLRDKTFREATSGGGVSLEENAEKTINVKSYTEPVEVTPAEGKDGMKKATVTLSDIPQLESNKSATIDVSTYSDPVEIEPSSGKDGMEKVTVALSNIPQLENSIEENVTENGEVVIEPSEGYDGVKRVTVNVAVPQETVESNKAETIDVSTYASPVEVTPDSPNTVMRKTTVSLSNIPQLENNKSATVDVSTYSAPVEVTPTAGKDGMKKATVSLSNIPQIESSKSESVTQNGQVTIEPSSGYAGIGQVTVDVAIPLEDNKAQTIDVSTYSAAVEVTPSQNKDAMKKATISLSNIPQLENNKSATIDVSTYSGAVEVTPSSGKDAMKKTTVSLSNIPQLEDSKTESTSVNGAVVVNPTSGYDGMKQVTVNVNIPLEDNKAQTIDVSSYSSAVEITPTAGKTAMKKTTVSLSNIPQLENNKAQTIDVSNYSAPVVVNPTSGKDGMKKATVTLSNIPVPGADLNKWGGIISIVTDINEAPQTLPAEGIKYIKDFDQGLRVFNSSNSEYISYESNIFEITDKWVSYASASNLTIKEFASNGDLICGKNGNNQGVMGYLFGQTPNLHTITSSPCLNSACSSDDIQVAVGDNGTIVTTDNIYAASPVFTTRTSGVNNNLNSIAVKMLRSSKLFVAVGDSGTILTSSDGIAWTSINSGVSVNLKKVIYTGLMFIAVGEEETILTSTDGSSWSVARTYQGGDTLNCVHFNSEKNVIVAAGNGGLILASEDAVSWSVCSISDNSVDFISVASQDGLFCYGTSAGSMYVGNPFESVQEITSPGFGDCIVSTEYSGEKNWLAFFNDSGNVVVYKSAFGGNTLGFFFGNENIHVW